MAVRLDQIENYWHNTLTKYRRNQGVIGIAFEQAEPPSRTSSAIGITFKAKNHEQALNVTGITPKEKIYPKNLRCYWYNT